MTAPNHSLEAVLKGKKKNFKVAVWHMDTHCNIQRNEIKFCTPILFAYSYQDERTRVQILLLMPKSDPKSHNSSPTPCTPAPNLHFREFSTFGNKLQFMKVMG